MPSSSSRAVHRPRRPSRALTLCAALLAATLAGGAAAQTARKPDKTARTFDDAPAAASSASAPKPPAADLPVMTRNELRACLKQRGELQAERESVLREQRQRDEEKASIQAEADALKQALAGLDRSSADAVQAYNTRADANDQRVDRYNAGNAEFNARAATLEQHRADYAQRCAGRRYNEDDLIVIEAGR